LRRAPLGAGFSRLLRLLLREQCSRRCGYLRPLPATRTGAERTATTVGRTRNAVRTSATVATALARWCVSMPPRAPVLSPLAAAHQETSAAEAGALNRRRPYAPRGRPSAPRPAGAKPYVPGPAPRRWFSTPPRARACVRPLSSAAPAAPPSAAIQPMAGCAAAPLRRPQDSADASLALLAATATSAAAAYVQPQRQVSPGSVPEGIDWTLRRDYSASLGREGAS
jgi:hypothetical protein